MKHKLVISVFMLGFSTFSVAEIKEIVAVSSEWRIDSTVDGGIQAYYTGSVCLHGKIKISSLADVGFKNRYWSLMMAAKTAKTKVQIFYDDTLDCEITNSVIPRDSEPLVP